MIDPSKDLVLQVWMVSELTVTADSIVEAKLKLAHLLDEHVGADLRAVLQGQTKAHQEQAGLQGKAFEEA